MIRYHRINESSSLWPPAIREEFEGLVREDWEKVFPNDEKAIEMAMAACQPFIEDADSIAEKIYTALKQDKDVTINRVFNWEESVNYKEWGYSTIIDFFNDFSRRREKTILSDICKKLFRSKLGTDGVLILQVPNGRVTLYFSQDWGRLVINAVLDQNSVQSKVDVRESYRRSNRYRNLQESRRYFGRRY